MEKIWYPIFEKEQQVSVKNLKDLGIDGLYIGRKLSKDIDINELKSEAKNSNLEVVSENDTLINHNLTTTIIDGLNGSLQLENEFVIKVKNELDNKKINGLLDIKNIDSLIAFQALALMSLLPGQLLIPTGLEKNLNSQTWDKLKKLLNLRKKYELINKVEISITEDSLLRVRRGKLIGYFNTNTHALGFNSKSIWIQNYLVGQLLPKGVVIKEEE